MKGEESIKEKGDTNRRGIEKSREKYYSNQELNL